jgi:ATP-dependent Clp protease ATP-binding subunit ClpC
MKPRITTIDRDRFSADALRLLLEADREAARLRHEYVGTEHIVLALANLGDGVVPATFRKRGLDPERVRRMLEDIVTPGKPSDPQPEERLYTSRTRKSFELADADATELGHESIAPEHLLLGVLGERMNIGAQVLSDEGLTYEEAKEEVKRQTN